jgi:hypothetical protein
LVYGVVHARKRTPSNRQRSGGAGAAWARLPSCGGKCKPRASALRKRV